MTSRGLVTRYKNMRKFSPDLYDVALKADTNLLDTLKAAEKLVKEYEQANPRRNSFAQQPAA